MLSFRQLIEFINRSTYKLDLAGVVGLIGNNAVKATETIPLFAGSRWLGWYNYPGAANVAEKFGKMANNRLWDRLFPGSKESPAITFDLANQSGPMYSGSFNGFVLQTKYLGHLLAETCRAYPSKPLRFFKKDGTAARETGSSTTVTVITLLPRQHEKISQNLSTSNAGVARQKYELIPIHPLRDYLLAFRAIVPMLISILTCFLCFLGQDPLCASLILLGIVSSGFSSLALGTTSLKIRVPVPSPYTPPGDGTMFPEDGSMIVLKGSEADVNIITKGEFELDYSNGMTSHGKHHMIGISSLFLMVQFFTQLFLIPLCTLFGQIMFLVSFVASGGYHLYVASREREELRWAFLLQTVRMRMDKRTLGTRTQMAVFVCLVLGDTDSWRSPMPDSDALLSRILPNETPVWRYWKRKVSGELVRLQKRDLLLPYAPNIQAGPEDRRDIDEYSRFSGQDITLLNALIDDAWCVFNGYPKWRDGLSEMGQEQGDDADKLGKVHWLPRGTPV